MPRTSARVWTPELLADVSAPSTAPLLVLYAVAVIVHPPNAATNLHLP
jgi:hypothetical protein